MKIFTIHYQNSLMINHNDSQVQITNPSNIKDIISQTLSNHFGELRRGVSDGEYLYSCENYGDYDEHVDSPILMRVTESYKRKKKLYKDNAELIKFKTVLRIYLPPSEPFKNSVMQFINEDSINEIISDVKNELREAREKTQADVYCGSGLFLSYLK